MDLTEASVLTALEHLPPKDICGANGVGLEDLVHKLCGVKPDSHDTESIKNILARLDSRGTISLLRMDIDSGSGPILGVHLNRES